MNSYGEFVAKYGVGLCGEYDAEYGEMNMEIWEDTDWTYLQWLLFDWYAHPVTHLITALLSRAWERQCARSLGLCLNGDDDGDGNQKYCTPFQKR